MDACRFDFSRGFVILLLQLLLICSSGSEVITVDVYAAKHLIKSGHGYMDVRYNTTHSPVPVLLMFNSA